MHAEILGYVREEAGNLTCACNTKGETGQWLFLKGSSITSPARRGEVYFQDLSSRTGSENMGLFSGPVLKINFLYWQNLFSGPVLTDSAGLL